MPTEDRHHPERSPDAGGAMFRAFFEQSTGYAAMLGLDGTVLEVNRQALAPWGRRREDVLGLPLWDGFWWRGAAPMVGRVREGVAQAAAGTVFRCDLPYFGADGSQCHADMIIAPCWARTAASPACPRPAPTPPSWSPTTTAMPPIRWRRCWPPAPELAFLDIGMPGMDGYQTAHRARSREAGFDLHLLKPAAPEQLAQVLAQAAVP